MSDERVRLLLERWYARIRATHKGHYKDAARLRRNQLWWGAVTACLAAIAGAGTFGSLYIEGAWMKMVGGSLSMVAAALASIQSFLNDPGRQSVHIIAATGLSSLKKRIEERLSHNVDSDELEKFAQEIRTEWDYITRSAPLMAERTYSKKVKPLVSPELFDLSTIDELEEPDTT